jgi:hypothetical protein
MNAFTALLNNEHKWYSTARQSSMPRKCVLAVSTYGKFRKLTVISQVTCDVLNAFGVLLHDNYKWNTLLGRSSIPHKCTRAASIFREILQVDLPSVMGTACMTLKAKYSISFFSFPIVACTQLDVTKQIINPQPSSKFSVLHPSFLLVTKLPLGRSRSIGPGRKFYHTKNCPE